MYWNESGRSMDDAGLADAIGPVCAMTRLEHKMIADTQVLQERKVRIPMSCEDGGACFSVRSIRLQPAWPEGERPPVSAFQDNQIDVP